MRMFLSWFRAVFDALRLNSGKSPRLHSVSNFAVFDIDGVIVDSSERFTASLRDVGASSLDELRGDTRRRFWEIFLSEKYIHLDKPNPAGIEAVREAKRQGYTIVVLTGRPETSAEATIKELRLFNVPWDIIIFRPRGCYLKNSMFKVGVLKVLFGRVDVVHDDSESVIEAVVRERVARRAVLWRNLRVEKVYEVE